MSTSVIEIDVVQAIWDGRWMALEMMWAGVVTSASTHWWFGPLFILLIVTAGRKKIANMLGYISQVFWRSHIE
jgi:hypothetical protein